MFGGQNENVVRASHNLKKVWTVPVNLLNAQQLLDRETLVITLDAVRWAEEALSTEPHGRRGRRAKAGETEAAGSEV